MQCLESEVGEMGLSSEAKDSRILFEALSDTSQMHAVNLRSLSNVFSKDFYQFAIQWTHDWPSFPYRPAYE